MGNGTDNGGAGVVDDEMSGAEIRFDFFSVGLESLP